MGANSTRFRRKEAYVRSTAELVQSPAEAIAPPPSDYRLVPARLGLVALFAVLIYVAVFWLITTIAGLYGHVLDP